MKYDDRYFREKNNSINFNGKISAKTQIIFRSHISRLSIANKMTVYFVSIQNRNVLKFEIVSFKLYLHMNLKVFRMILLI